MADAKAHALLSAHRDRMREIATERQRIMQQQSEVLRGYVHAGVPLPAQGSAAAGRAGGGGAAAARGALVQQLVLEESAAMAALEALKQGATLGRARDIASKVLRHQADLAHGSGDGPAAAVLLQPGTGDAPGAPRRAAARSVFLSAGAPQQVQGAWADHQGGAGGSGEDDDVPGEEGSAGAATSPTPLPRRAPGSARRAAAGPALAPAAIPAAGARQLRSALKASDRRLLGEDDTGATGGADAEAAAQAEATRGRPGSGRNGGGGDGHDGGGGGGTGIEQLRIQVASLQAALDARPQQPPPGWGPYGAPIVFHHAPPPQPQPPPPPPPPQQQQQHNDDAGAAGASAGAQRLPPELAADPEVSAAHARHVRDMALMRMRLERARAAGELARLQAEAAEAEGPAAYLGGGGGGMYTGPSTTEELEPPPAPQEQALAAGGPLPSDPSDQPPEPSLMAPGEERGDEGAASAQRDSRPDVGVRLSGPAEAPAEDWGRHGERRGTGEPAAGALGRERLASDDCGALAAARGANADTDVLRVTIQGAGAFTKRGTYRVCVALYDGLQPVEAGHGTTLRAYTGKRAVGLAGPGAPAPPDSPAAAAAAAAAGGGLTAKWGETVTLRGLRLGASSLLVFELRLAKPGVAGLPTREALVAWTFAPVLARGQVVPGIQSVPLFRLPLVLSARRKFTYDGALLDFRVARFSGAPGDLEAPPEEGAGGGLAAGVGLLGGASVGAGAGAEDVPGVPTDAWVRVQRGTPPSDPFTPGDGFVVLIDGARFLPSSVTITKATACVWSSSGRCLSAAIEGVALADGDAASPSYWVQRLVGQGAERFEDPTATIMFQIHTVERFTRALAVVAFALLPVFLDPREGGQPVSRSIRDYVLNQGAFQLPLHAGAPSTQGPLRASSLDDVPRIPCATLLVRVMAPEAAKQQRRRRPPAYGDRLYDSTRCAPSAVERRLYPKLLAPPRTLGVREAARLAAYLLRRGPRRAAGSAVVSARVTSEDAPQQAGAPPEPAPKAGILSWVLGGGGGGGAAAGAAAAGAQGADGLALLAEELGPSEEEVAFELEASKGEALPPSDPEIMDWMEDALEGRGGAAPGSFIGFNTAREYQPDLGFFVAVDGAHRISRLLPSAALCSRAPPGSFYQDHPVVDDVKVTLDYDLAAPLAAPRWLDGYQQFLGTPYSPGLCVIVDVRYVVPAAGSSAPAGWALLPVFERCGAFVASGTYHLPLFQGVPGSTLLAEVAARGDPHAVMLAQIKSGRIRPSLGFSSVTVRLMCATRAGQLGAPAWLVPLQSLRLPRYAATGLGAKHVAEMRKTLRNKTYSQAKPQALTDDQWVDQINDAVIKAAGLDADDAGDDANGAGADDAQQGDEPRGGGGGGGGGGAAAAGRAGVGAAEDY